MTHGQEEASDTGDNEHKFELDETDEAVEQRRHCLFPISTALDGLAEMLDEYGDADFQQALNYSSHIPVSDRVRSELQDYVEGFRLRARELLSLLAGAQTMHLCPGDGEHEPHVVLSLSRLAESYLDQLQEGDPELWEIATDDTLNYCWPWLGIVNRDEDAEEEVLNGAGMLPIPGLDGPVPLITSEQTTDQIKALRDSQHHIKVIVPVPFDRMDANNAFNCLENFVEDAIGGDNLILTQVTTRPIGVHAGTHILVGVEGIADFTWEIDLFGGPAKEPEDDSDSDD